MCRSVNLCLSFSLLLLQIIPSLANAENTDQKQVRDVEIGAGGRINIEKTERSEIEEEFAWHAHLMWESRYVTEGRDNLAGDAIYSASTEFNFGDFNFIPWFAKAVDTDYSELDLNIIYGKHVRDDLSLFVGYNHIRTTVSDETFIDNEVNIGFGYSAQEDFELVSNVYYSFDAEGAFGEIVLEKIYAVDSKLVVNVGATLGFNFGYVSAGHRGANHGQLVATLTYLVVRSLDVYAYIGYNSPVNRDADRYADDESLNEFLWGGIGLSYRF
jgi:hypothetical protein